MAKSFSIGEVWYVKFPLEEDPSLYIERPAIIADVMLPKVAVIKVTKHDPRDEDKYDTKIMHCSHAKLTKQSTARVSKYLAIHKSQIINKKGALHPEDHESIFARLDQFIEENS